jgi:peptidoglycan/xylan/chitin deacetylase (PgdA/CDA1 family)
MHGIVPALSRDRQSFRSYITADEFAYLLGRRARPFGSLEEALDGGGDALTVDDATRASADAALQARALGHEVTLFVNGYHIVSGKPYAFDLLNAILDGARTGTVEREGGRYDLRRPDGRAALRKALRRDLRRLRSEAERERLVAHWTEWLGADPEIVPGARPLSLEEVHALQEAGVRIENHGWTHTDPDALDADSLAREVMECSRWLKSALGVSSRMFAAPYGDSVPDSVSCWPSEIVYLAANSRMKPGRLGDRLYNRVSFRETWKENAA